jgi:prepilin-type N-terminal cleavage/methylation domain-containing protein
MFMKLRNSQRRNPRIRHKPDLMTKQTGLDCGARLKRSDRSDEAGFTLLETAIALVILAIVGLGIASMFVVSARNSVSASDRDLAMAVAQQQMEQLRNVPFTDATLAATAGGGTSITVTRAGRRYVVLTTIADSNTISGTVRTKTITLRVTPWSDGAAFARNVTSIFGSVTMVSLRTSQAVGPNRAL